MLVRQPKKLVVSHAGSQGVFGLVESALSRQLNGHQSELVYGHKSYWVNIDVESVPFEAAVGEEASGDEPVLHIFWTDADTEAYRNHVKEQLSGWYDRLQRLGLQNYIVIHAIFQDRLPPILHKFSVTKTSMMERIRGDFGSQRADRTIMFKAESSNISSSQSWLSAVEKIRVSIIKSVTLNLATMEKTVSQIRDSHEEENFDLYKYIAAKEQLCSLYEQTGLYEEAYRSSEEILSLFRQYVASIRHCQIVPWIEEFLEAKISSWEGLSLGDPITVTTPHTLTSLQLCCTVFRRIVQQLTAMQNPKDLARKGLLFLLQTIQECRLLKVNYPRGSMVIWVYIGCLELLEAVKQASHQNNMDISEALAVAKGQLYSLAREKLEVIGRMAGHLEEGGRYSEEEIKVLVAGSKNASVEKIFSDRTYFHKQYIDLSQLAIVSFKQGSWSHHAQHINLALALYLRNTGNHTECLNAEIHLREVCNSYHAQGWTSLASHARVKLCDTQRELGLTEHEVVSCCHLAVEGSDSYSERLLGCLDLLNSSKIEEPTLLPLQPLFQVNLTDNAEFRAQPVRVKGDCRVEFRVTNCALRPIPNATVVVKFDTDRETLNRSRSQADPADLPSPTDRDPTDGLSLISLRAETELAAARVESGARRAMLGSSQPLTLQPGDNLVEVKLDPRFAGNYGLHTLQIQVGRVVFREKSPGLPPWFSTLTVDKEASSVEVTILQPPARMFISGQEQFLPLSILSEKHFHSLSITLKSDSPNLAFKDVENGIYELEEDQIGMFSVERVGESWNLTLPAVHAHKPIALSLPLTLTTPTLFSREPLCVSWPGGEQDVYLAVHQPFLCSSHSRFTGGDEVFLVLELSSNLPQPVTLDSLETAGDPSSGGFTPVLPFTSTSLIPRQSYSFIWRGCTGSPLPETVTIGYTSCELVGTFTHSFPAAPTPPLFSASVTCLTETPREGFICRFQVQLKSEDTKSWRLLCGVHTLPHEWAVCGFQRRQLDLKGSLSFTVELVPICRGKLEFPRVVIWEFRETQLQTTGTSRDLHFITSSDSPLGGGGPPPARRRSGSLLPRAEKLDYSAGRERSRPVTSIVLNTMTTNSIAVVPAERLASFNTLSLVEVQ